MKDLSLVVGLSANKGNKRGRKRTKKPTAVCLCSHSTSLNAEIRVSSSGLAIKTVRQLHLLCLKRGRHMYGL